jgi:hypothetical protein
MRGLTSEELFHLHVIESNIPLAPIDETIVNNLFDRGLIQESTDLVYCCYCNASHTIIRVTPEGKVARLCQRLAEEGPYDD